MKKYLLIIPMCVLIGWGIAEGRYWVENNPEPVKHNQVSFEERILKAGDRIERLLIQDARREEARG